MALNKIVILRSPRSGRLEGRTGLLQCETGTHQGMRPAAQALRSSPSGELPGGPAKRVTTSMNERSTIGFET